MSALESMLNLRPLLLRRMLLVLFAGPILIAALASEALGLARPAVEHLCRSFDAAWFDRTVSFHA